MVKYLNAFKNHTLFVHYEDKDLKKHNGNRGTLAVDR